MDTDATQLGTMSDKKLHIINCKFLGSRLLESDITDIELGGHLYSIGNKRWTWRRPQVTLGFVQKSFVISFIHHGEKTCVLDLRDASKVSVHPTRERVLGFVLNDRASQKRRFMCFKLANMKGEEFKKLHKTKLQLHHPPPKVKKSVAVQQPQKFRSVRPAAARPARPQYKSATRKVVVTVPYTNTDSTAFHSLCRRPSLPEDKKTRKTEPTRHKYGSYVNGKLVAVQQQTKDGATHTTHGQASKRKPVSNFRNEPPPAYENLSQYQRLEQK